MRTRARQRSAVGAAVTLREVQHRTERLSRWLRRALPSSLGYHHVLGKLTRGRSIEVRFGCEKAGSTIEKSSRIWYAFSVGSFRRALDESYCSHGTAVMGVLNATPDSFYDGGQFVGAAAAARVAVLAHAGAFVIDIGGESNRPGAASVSANEQLERIEPAVKSAVAEARQRTSLWVSVDTCDPMVAEAVLGWGAHIVNDVSCLADPDLARVTARAGAALLLMHARGPMADMPAFSEYPDSGYLDVVRDVADEWRKAYERANALGLPAEDVLFDPGIGFAKNALQSMELLRRLGEFDTLGVPVVVGLSRKSFLQLIEVCPAEARLGATIAACLYAAEQGAQMVRVHDVAVVGQALRARRLFASWRNCVDVGKNHGDPGLVGSERSEGVCSTPS